MTDLSRRKTLLLLGTAGTTLSGCLSSFGSSGDGGTETGTTAENETAATPTSAATRTRTRRRPRTSEATQTRTETETRTQTRTQTRTPTPSNAPARLRYKKDIRKQAWTSGRSLSAVSGIGEWTATGGETTSVDGKEFGGDSATRLVSPEDASRATMETTFEKPLDLRNTTLSLGVRLKRAGAETVSIRLLAPDTQNRATMGRYLQKKDGALRLDIAPGEVSGSPDLSSVRGLQITSYTGSGEPFELHVGAFRLRKTPRQQRGRGAVILTFDDGFATTIDTAKPIMDKLGYAGVVGIIPWNIGMSDRLTKKQLHSMASQGWEMASHPHPPAPNLNVHLPKLPESTQRKVIERSKQWLLDEAFPTNGETFVWPFGDFDSELFDLVSEYHRLSFGGGSSPAPWSITEPAWVPRINGDDPEDVRQAVDMAAKFGSVVTVMYHEIGTSSRISTKEFRKELQYVDQSDVDVVVPSELSGAQPY